MLCHYLSLRNCCEYAILRSFIKKGFVFFCYTVYGHTGIPGLRTQVLNVGLFTLDSGLWMLDPGRWTLDVGLWTLNSGRWTLDTEVQTMGAGLWTLGTGL